jgi:DNA-binding XRE family transcriptional regulator
MFNIVGRFRKAFGIHMNKKAEKLDVRVTFNEGAKTPVRITARTKKLRSTLIDKLEEYRISNHLSKKQMADRMNVHVQTYYNWLRGEHNMRRNMKSKVYYMLSK